MSEREGFAQKSNSRSSTRRIHAEGEVCSQDRWALLRQAPIGFEQPLTGCVFRSSFVNPGRSEGDRLLKLIAFEHLVFA